MFKLAVVFLSSIIYLLSPSSAKDPSVVDRAVKAGAEEIFITDIFKADSSGAVVDFYRLRDISNSEFVRFSKAAARKGLKVRARFAPEYTSTSHPWFRQSMEADSELVYSNFYLWKDSISVADSASWAKVEDLLPRTDTLLPRMDTLLPRTDTLLPWMDTLLNQTSASGAGAMAATFRTGFYRNDGLFGQARLNLEDKSDTSAVQREFNNIRTFWKSKGLILSDDAAPIPSWTGAQPDSGAIQQQKVKMAYILTQPIAVIEEGDEAGIEAFTSSMLRLRKRYPAFQDGGTLSALDGASNAQDGGEENVRDGASNAQDGGEENVRKKGGVIAYCRTDGKNSFLVLLNPGQKRSHTNISGLAKAGSRPAPIFSEGRANLSTEKNGKELDIKVSMGPGSVLIVKL